VQQIIGLALVMSGIWGFNNLDRETLFAKKDYAALPAVELAL
jgi:hypothetical protein